MGTDNSGENDPSVFNVKKLLMSDRHHASSIKSTVIVAVAHSFVHASRMYKTMSDCNHDSILIATIQ